MDILDLYVYLSEKTVKCVLIYTIFFSLKIFLLIMVFRRHLKILHSLLCNDFSPGRDASQGKAHLFCIRHTCLDFSTIIEQSTHLSFYLQDSAFRIPLLLTYFSLHSIGMSLRFL